MKDTRFSVPADKLDRLATSYFTNMETGEVAVFARVEGSRWGSPPAHRAQRFLTRGNSPCPRLVAWYDQQIVPR